MVGSKDRHQATPRPLRGRIAASIAITAIVFGGAISTLSAAWADGPTTFSNTTAITIPESGQANPYPSSISVSGMTGVVTGVQVVLHGLTHSAVGDVDVMVVAPTGENVVLLSDVGEPGSGIAADATLTFDDAATGGVPSGTVSTGTYLPTNVGGGDGFASPAPTPSTETALNPAFTGLAPNGTWRLFVVDDSPGDTGSIAGGWSLTVTTDVAVATTTTVSTSGSPSTTGSSVTFTAMVSAAGNPVTTGSATFHLDGILIGSVPLSGSGTAQWTANTLTEGTHVIDATYSGSTGFLASDGSVSQRVDNPTIVTGETYCNTGVVTIPAGGPATPYSSNITVTGLTGVVASVTATLHGVSHSSPADLDVMLSGPTPSTNLLLMSDTGGGTPVSDATIAFADEAAGPVPTPLIAGTFLPTNDDSGGADLAFPAPAPVIGSATTLSTFNGVSGNGVWSLWVLDDAAGDTGSINGGWCLSFTTASAPPTDSTPDGLLPTTGAPATGLTLVASGLLFFGAAMIVVTRRRRLSGQS